MKLVVRTRVAAVLLATLLASSLVAVAQARQVSADRAREDLRLLVREITTRHPNPYYLTPKADFDRAVAELSARIPALAPHEIAAGFQRIAALVGDGHTGVGMATTTGFLPVELEWLDGSWRIIRTTPAYRALLGVTVTSIGDTPIDAAFTRASALAARHESEGWTRYVAARLLTNVDVLDALDIVPDRGPVTLTGVLDSGERRSVPVTPAERPSLGALVEAASPPLSRRPEVIQSSFAWRSLDAGLAYVAFQNYTGGDFGSSVRTAFREMDAAKVSRVVLDLRWNGGGDFTRGRDPVLREIRARERWLKPGALYVLIGRRTFSAAMVNAVDFKRAAGAILVGEPTGARPNSYSETGVFRLPNLGVRATVSICRYEFWPEDVAGVPPDQAIPPAWADYRDGRDAALEWIVKQPQPDPASAPFKQTATLPPPCRR